jgi:hypothetical protein
MWIDGRKLAIKLLREWYLPIVVALIAIAMMVWGITTAIEERKYDNAVRLMQECDRCKTKEAANWEAAASRRIDQITACETELEWLKHECSTDDEP